jgi:hypothetical protein
MKQPHHGAAPAHSNSRPQGVQMHHGGVFAACRASAEHTMCHRGACHVAAGVLQVLLLISQQLQRLLLANGASPYVPVVASSIGHYLTGAGWHAADVPANAWRHSTCFSTRQRPLSTAQHMLTSAAQDSTA